MDFESIKLEINEADIVSFDIFDTLVTRIVLHPIDVFSIVNVLAKQRLGINFDYKSTRIEAEQSLLKSNLRKNYNFEDIFSYIQKKHHLTDDLCHKLSDIELEVEEKVAIPRNDVLELFNELYTKGKKIIFVSDMYFSSAQIQRFLISCGYRTDNVNIFVSNEYNAIKADGSLWEIVSKKYNTQSLIHIGDNRQSDFLSAKKWGINPISIKSSLEQFQQSKMFLTLSEYDDGSIGNSILLGRLCNEMIFNSAFSADYDKNKVLGIFNGAVFSCFMRWLINTRDDSLLLFVTREGFIFQPMYKAYCEAANIVPQKNCLFYTSRQAVSKASIRNSKDLEDLLSMTYSGKLIGFVRQKCGYPIGTDVIEDVSISLPKDKEKAFKVLQSFLPELIDNSRNARDVYNKYIDNCCAENSCESLTIVDIGYLATTQFLLTKITDKKLNGKYLITDIGVYEPIINDVKSLGKIAESAHPIHNNLQFFESSIQVPYGQLLSVNQDDEGNITFAFNDAKQTSPLIVNAQKECLDFSRTDAEWFGYLNQEYDYPLNMAEDVWMCLIYYNYLPLEYINSFSFDDEFNGNEMFKYDPESHAFKTSTQTIPFAFSRSKSNAFRKQKIKNFVKRHVPSFLYSPMKAIWIRYIR